MTSLNPITQLPDDLIVLDTETTGFDPQEGHRVVEIAAIRMRGGLPTDEVFHVYINPQRDMPQGAFEVHGLSSDFLSDKPTFDAVAADFLAFVGDSPWAAHNAPFDLKFLNAELARLGLPPFPTEKVHDTIAVARRLFPGAQANLDALCRRFKISLAKRDKHSALVDTELLADVVVEMGGGRQQTLFGAGPATGARATTPDAPVARPAAFVLPTVDVAAHQAFVAKELGADSVWAKIYAGNAATTPNEEAA